jgi:hypothetical protein
MKKYIAPVALHFLMHQIEDKRTIQEPSHETPDPDRRRRLPRTAAVGLRDRAGLGTRPLLPSPPPLATLLIGRER